MLRRQVEAAARRSAFLPMVASEIEFYLFDDTYDEAHAKGYRDLRPHSPWLEDYHILQTTKDEYVIGAIRRGLRGRRRAGRVLARVRPDAASTRSTSTTRRPSRWPTATRSTSTAAKEIAAAPRPLGVVHGQVGVRRHRVVVPRPLQPVDASTATLALFDGGTTTRSTG